MSRVMLSSQRLWPRSWSSWVAFMVSPPEKVESAPARRQAGRSKIPERSAAEGFVHHRLGFLHNAVQVGLVLEALRIDLVDVLRAGGPGREPAAGGHDFQPSDRRIVGGS